MGKLLLKQPIGIHCPVVSSTIQKTSFKTAYSLSYDSFADASGINSTTKEKVAVNICSMASFRTYCFKGGFYFQERTIKFAG
jgi:hypothetical protein